MKNIVVLTGAGISKESGINTFRDSDGLWENYRIEDVANFDSWQKNPDLVRSFYNQRRKQAMEAKPNQAHKELVSLESHFNVYIITQNIDDLLANDTPEARNQLRNNVIKYFNPKPNVRGDVVESFINTAVGIKDRESKIAIAKANNVDLRTRKSSAEYLQDHYSEKCQTGRSSKLRTADYSL